MITVCAWNRPEDGPHDPTYVLADDGTNDGRLSHGICHGHKEAVLATLPRRTKETAS